MLAILTRARPAIVSASPSRAFENSEPLYGIEQPGLPMHKERRDYVMFQAGGGWAP